MLEITKNAWISLKKKTLPNLWTPRMSAPSVTAKILLVSRHKRRVYGENTISLWRRVSIECCSILHNKVPRNNNLYLMQWDNIRLKKVKCEYLCLTRASFIIVSPSNYYCSLDVLSVVSHEYYLPPPLGYPIFLLSFLLVAFIIVMLSYLLCILSFYSVITIILACKVYYCKCFYPWFLYVFLNMDLLLSMFSINL